MNAIDFLIKEHDHVRAGMAEIKKGSHHFETQQKKFSVLAKDLLRHESMEHEVWYPHFKEKLPHTVKHLLSEEKHAEKAIKKLAELQTEETWNKHFTEFKEAVEHHAKEEENQLFPEVKKILSEQELMDIGKKMNEFKKKHA